MKRFSASVLAVAIVLGIAGCDLDLDKRRAKARVQTVLECIQADGGGNSGHMQLAIKQWLRGPDVDMGELEAGQGKFADWCREKDIYRQISSFSVGDAVAEPEGGGAIVNVTIESKPYKIRVPYGGRMSWAS
jgi:hypothetical protein